MNPSNNETGMQLPAPVAEMPPVAGQAAEATPSSVPERAPSAPERGPASTAQTAVALATAAPVQTPTPAAGTQPVAGGAATADDGDLIEKEWVSKAKQIVEHTRDDPYKQSEGLTMLKVDYMKKRYGKTLKISS